MLNERNNLKLFNDRYGKIKNRILDIDSVQDDYFKKQLEFDFLKTLNCHYNLGVFVNEEKEIVGNTQLFSYIMNDSKSPKFFIDAETFNKFGYENGTVIASVKEALSSYYVEHVPSIHVVPIPIYYKDFNTNKSFARITGVAEYDKELTLRLLHLISALGFMKNIICCFTGSENIWNTRVKYILIYHMIQSLNILSNKYPNLFLWFRSTPWFVNTNFRNCMMHYDLYQNDKPIIPLNHIKTEVPMFGIIEFFFNGKTYPQLTQDLDAEMNYIYDNMRKMLKIDLSDVQAF